MYLAVMSTSRLTRSPGVRLPRVVRDSVVGISLTSNQLWSTALTVSETPSNVMLPFAKT